MGINFSAVSICCCNECISAKRRAISPRASNRRATYSSKSLLRVALSTATVPCFEWNIGRFIVTAKPVVIRLIECKSLVLALLFVGKPGGVQPLKGGLRGGQIHYRYQSQIRAAFNIIEVFSQVIFFLSDYGQLLIEIIQVVNLQLRRLSGLPF